jgi:hypothetical protein
VALMMVCRLNLANGWTVSISESDTPPALCSVAAWPTAKDNHRLADEDWFRFDDRGNFDQRCWVLEDVRKALAQVQNAAPPEGAS